MGFIYFSYSTSLAYVNAASTMGLVCTFCHNRHVNLEASSLYFLPTCRCGQLLVQPSDEIIKRLKLQGFACVFTLRFAQSTAKTSQILAGKEHSR
jgi:hypothetical protein